MCIQLPAWCAIITVPVILTLALSVSLSLPPSTRCRVQKSATADFVSLVSLYGDQRRGPTLLALWARRVHWPFTVHFLIWKWVQQKPQGGEGRERREWGERGMDGGEFPPTLTTALRLAGCWMSVKTAAAQWLYLLISPHAIGVIINRIHVLDTRNYSVNHSNIYI